ncbi:phage tail protein [Vibrio fluvialis]|uniref:phage tail protein n=1 Tax=Vibrio fluvialis TaxID=676 RepID=UPI001EE9B3D8|nr:phage tail protein [Vibrio fluvialis]MCG6363874.1 phage tail protein [Vibrio fluvialis]
MADENTDLRCYLTNAGIASENNSIQLNRSLNVTEMVFGSGLLADEKDPREQTAMIKEEYAVPCALLFDEDTPTLLVFKGDLPADVGGFHINEVGIRLEDGTIYGYARGKGDYKPTLDQGATDSVRYAVEMYSSNADNVVAKIDLSTVYVDWEDLEERIAAHKTETDPHKQYEQKSNSATNEDIDSESTFEKHIKLPQFWRALTPQRLVDKLWLGLAARIFPVGAAIPWFTDVAPDGFGMFKGQAFDMATYPELAKVFPDGIIPDMRGCGVIGKEDGETVGVFEEGEVKSHGHPSSTVSGTDLGTKTTNTTGNHYHASNTPNEKALNSTYGSGLPSSVNTNSYGRHASTSTAGNHAHTVAIGSHAHTIAIALFGALKNTINHRKVNWIVRLA